MKRILSGILIFGLLSIAFAYAVDIRRDGSRVYIGLSVANVDGNSFPISAGDTLILQSGTRDHLRFANIQGDSLHPVIITNDSGIVYINTLNFYYGIQFYNCAYFRFTGQGNADTEYGIKILQTPSGTNGLTLEGRSSDFEVDHIEISNTGFAGIFALTKPDCSGTTTRDEFVMKNVTFRQNYIHDTFGEGFYIGHSYYAGYKTECAGNDTLLFPHEIHNLHVNNNLLERCGYDAIQVGCASKSCFINNNVIYDYGWKNVENQQSGIQLGAGTTGECFDNSILCGTGNGINLFGQGKIMVYNNVIACAGHSHQSGVEPQKAYGIFCDDRSTNDSTTICILNNTIVKSTSDGIRFYSTQSSENKIYNNLILSSGELDFNPSQSYIFLGKGVDADKKNNLYIAQISTMLDCSNVNDIYDYSGYFDVVEKGIDIQKFGIDTDFFGRKRTRSGSSDIGAFELEKSVIKAINNGKKTHVYLNSDHQLNVANDVLSKVIYAVQVYDVSGKIAANYNQQIDVNETVSIPVALTKGVYLVKLNTGQTFVTQKLVVW